MLSLRRKCQIFMRGSNLSPSLSIYIYIYVCVCVCVCARAPCLYPRSNAPVRELCMRNVCTICRGSDSSKVIPTTAGFTVLSFCLGDWQLKLRRWWNTKQCTTPTFSTLGGRAPGQFSRYNDSLRAGRSGDRIPVLARYSAPAHTGPGADSASCIVGTGCLSQE